MNKKDAAVFLEVSEKSLERFVNKGLLSSRLEKGKTRDVVIFDDTELQRFKADREAVRHRPAVEQETFSQAALLPIPTNTEIADRRGESNIFSRFTDALETFAEAQRIAALQQKPMLNLADAAAVSGLSITLIETAVKAGTIKTFQGLRGSKVIRRKDLDLFIENLK